MGARGTIPWARNHYGGCRMAAEGAEKSHNVTSTFFNTVHLEEVIVGEDVAHFLFSTRRTNVFCKKGREY